MCVGYSPEQVPKFRLGKQTTTSTVLISIIGSAPIPFVKRDWKKIDPKFQALIKQCLEYEPKNRISASEALQHEALN